MRNAGAVIALLAGLLLVGAPASAQSGSSAASFVPGEVLVKFKPGAPDHAVAALHARAAGRAKRHFPRIRLHHVETSLPVADAIRLYQASPLVEYAEPDYLVHHDEAAMATPGDPLFPQLWGLHNTGQTGGVPDADIDAPEAWALQTGSRSVVVAVIDSGVDYTHPDLAPNMFRNVADCDGNGVDDDGNGYVDDCFGIDTINGDSDPMDDNSHGTHVAGTIGAVGDNGLGVVGVNWGVSILACKFLGSTGSGPTSAAIACLDYVRAMRARGVNIVATSNSWGGGGLSLALRDAIEASGVLFVAAAGNSGTDNDASPHYPCSYDLPNVVCVAATTHADARAFFSNFGATSVDLGAPGEAILSTVPGGVYQFKSGTSMATPHVTGVAALLFSEFPGITADQAKCRLLAGVDLVPTLVGLTVTGGRLNAVGALTATGCGGGGGGSAADVVGRVSAEGAPESGANVVLTNKATRARVTTKTDGTGTYTFDPVASGTYQVVIRPVTVAVGGAVAGSLEVGGAPTVGIRIKLTNVATGATMKTITDATGAFSFPGVGPGTYRILIAAFTVP